MRAVAASLCIALGSASLASTPVVAQDHRQAETQALELLKRGIAYRTVAGDNNETPLYAAYLKDQLVAGGFSKDDVRVEPIGDTAYLLAYYRGSGSNKAKPIVISAHMDVVDAKPEDWERDPFTAIIGNGYIYGRGTSDNKFDLSVVVATLIQLKREGYRPKRDIILAFSGDEETKMRTTAALSDQLRDAEMVINIDSGGGDLDEAGKPVKFGVQSAEKTYADFELSVTNPGGHSSAPRVPNAIYQLSAALQKIAAHEFPGQVNDVTQYGLEASAAQSPDPKLAQAMRDFAADPSNIAARSLLRANPSLIGQTGTTCVATLVNAGHATNALPQRATANVNCRIFPGTPIADIQAALERVIADPAVKIRKAESGSIPSPASPINPALLKVVEKAVHARFPGTPVVPVMSSGATDSMFFRAKGVPAYGLSGIFMKASDGFAHGLNERVPLNEIAPTIRFYKSVITDLTK